MMSESRERFMAPGEARLVKLNAGQNLDIIDVKGKQVADLVVFPSANLDAEWLSATHTRSSLGRLNLLSGDELRTNLRRSILRLVRDDVGVHDMLCDVRP